MPIAAVIQRSHYLIAAHVLRVHANLATRVAQRDKAILQDTCASNGFCQHLKVGRITHVPDTAGLSAAVLDGLVTGQIGLAEDIHLTIEGLSGLYCLDRVARRVQLGADGALPVTHHIGRYTHIVVALTGEQRSRTAHDFGQPIYQGKVVGLRCLTE